MGLPPIDLQVFHENGYTRRSCRVTGLWFWSSDPNRDTCGDTEEDEYTFIGAPIIDGFSQRGRELKDAMREQFIGFFEQRESIPGLSLTRFLLGGEMIFISQLQVSQISNHTLHLAQLSPLPIHWQFLSLVLG